MKIKNAIHVLLLALFLSAGQAFAVEEPANETQAVEVVETAPAPAETVPTPSVTPTTDLVTHEQPQADVGTAVVKLMEGVQNKNWLLVSCAVLMILIWVWNIFIMPRLFSSEKHPKWRAASPWISIGVAVAAQFASAIIAGNSWVDALNTAAMMGFTTSGMWSAGGKKALGVVEQKLRPAPKK